MMKPYNPYFFPVLCCAAFANLVVNSLDDGKTETVPAGPLGQMVTIAVATSTNGMIVGTAVMHTIVEATYETWLGQIGGVGTTHLAVSYFGLPSRLSRLVC